MISTQPVVTYDAIKAAIAAGVLALWQVAPDPIVQVVSAVLGVLLYAALTWVTQRLVTPLSDPKDANGVPLVTAGRHAAPDPEA